MADTVVEDQIGGSRARLPTWRAEYVGGLRPLSQSHRRPWSTPTGQTLDVVAVNEPLVAVTASTHPSRPNPAADSLRVSADDRSRFMHVDCRMTLYDDHVVIVLLRRPV